MAVGAVNDTTVPACGMQQVRCRELLQQAPYHKKKRVLQDNEAGSAFEGRKEESGEQLTKTNGTRDKVKSALAKDTNPGVRLSLFSCFL